MKETKFSFHIQITVYMTNIVDSWYLGGEDIHILLMKEKLVIFKLRMLHLVHQDYLDQYTSQNLLVITRIQVEGVTSVQNQYLYMDQFRNNN